MSGHDAGDRFDRVLERLRRDAEAPLGDPRGGFADVERRRVRRRREAWTRVAVVAAAVAGAAALSLWWGQDGGSPAAPSGAGAPSVAARTPGAPAGPIEERPVAYAAEEGARLRQIDDRTFALEAGTVWFSVEPGRGGLEVRTPDRTVVVLGTVFAVRVEPSGGTRVGVASGRVRVLSRDGVAIDLEAGEELAGDAPTPQPLDPAWRARMTALFPRRLAREERAARPASPAPPPPPGAPPPPVSAPGAGTVPVPEVAPVPVVEPPGPAAPAGRPEAEPPAGRPPAAENQAGRPATPERPRTWSERYAAAEALLRAGDAAAAAAELEALVESAPSSSAAEVTLLDLARVCRQQLRDPIRAQALYQRYLDRYPNGQLREDARLALCNLLGARGQGVAERECLQQYLTEFPRGSAAGTVRARLGLPSPPP